MSLLWPETISIGLFPDHCWIKRGRLEAAHRIDAGALGAPADLLGALEQMLGAPGKPLRKGTRLRLLVSDSVVSIATLPWQEQLMAPDELHAYAQACFEKQGLAMDAGWTLHAGFRQYGALGMAHAIRHEWLEAVIALAKTQGAQVRSVIPVSACAYWRQGRSSKLQQTLVLLHEARRVSALIYDHGVLQGFDVEPILSSEVSAGERLLRRISATHSTIGSVCAWSAHAPELAPKFDFIKDRLPGAKLNFYDRNIWS
ncbi:hypothetical protein [Undibacterium sp.]|uniref:hypothetical protein n=1 Tax=Undibacterium sp. TaxID=1914977 RepID=UPI002B71589B|nr:hypothetical protein [Undibacterium sp.]HTD05246.1 hypothetical protein [Undibacterium sp.]